MEGTGCVKTFHAVDKDCLSLRRDFGVCLNAVIDTKEAVKSIRFLQNAIGFESLCEEMEIKDPTPRGFKKDVAQLADWRIRTLHKELQRYARNDTHLLLRAWLKIKIQVKNKKVGTSENLDSHSSKLFY